MAVTRPLKEGSVTTYQAKVAAGFPDILASEMDADLDTIYAAWNGGVSTANIGDGSITTAKLAPNLQTWQTGAGNPITPIDPTKVVEVPSGYLRLVNGGILEAFLASGAPVTQLFANASSEPGYVAAHSSWLTKWDANQDQFAVYRQAPNAGAYTTPLILDNAGNLTITGKLSGGAASGLGQAIATSGSFTTSTYNAYVPVVTLPALTTRGGVVLLTANHALTYNQLGASGNVQVAVAWFRNGTYLAESDFKMGGSIVAPVPPFVMVDTPGAGTWTYDVRVYIASGTSAVVTAGGTNSYSAAREIG